MSSISVIVRQDLATKDHAPMRTIKDIKLVLFIILALQLSFTTAQSEGMPKPEDCLVALKNGRKVMAERFWRITRGNAEYEYRGSLHDLAADDILWIECQGIRFILNDSMLTAEPADTTVILVSGQNGMQALGKKNADAHYNGTGAMITGLLLSPTIIGPPLVALIPPRSPSHRDPDRQLYYSDPDYRDGWRKTAHSKKAGNIILGMTIGVFAMIFGPAIF
jgi:hypothetical protein